MSAYAKFEIVVKDPFCSCSRVSGMFDNELVSLAKRYSAKLYLNHVYHALMQFESNPEFAHWRENFDDSWIQFEISISVNSTNAILIGFDNHFRITVDCIDWLKAALPIEVKNLLCQIEQKEFEILAQCDCPHWFLEDKDIFSVTSKFLPDRKVMEQLALSAGLELA